MCFSLKCNLNDILFALYLMLFPTCSCFLFLGPCTLRERGSWILLDGVVPSRQQQEVEETHWASSSLQRQTYLSSFTAAFTTSRSVVRDTQRCIVTQIHLKSHSISSVTYIYILRRFLLTVYVPSATPKLTSQKQLYTVYMTVFVCGLSCCL